MNLAKAGVGEILSLTMGQELTLPLQLGQSSSLSKGLDITWSFVTWESTSSSTLRARTLGRVEI